MPRSGGRSGQAGADSTASNLWTRLNSTTNVDLDGMKISSPRKTSGVQCGYLTRVASASHTRWTMTGRERV